MKYLFTALCFLFVLTACNNNGYTINGSYPDAPDGTKVYLALLDENFTYVDSATVDDGRFLFEGKKDTPVVRMLLSSIALEGGPVVVENGDVKVQLKYGIRRWGTPLNDDLQRFFDERGTMSHRIESAVAYIAENKNIGDAQRDSLRTMVETARRDFVNTLQHTIGGNMNNALGAFLLTQSEEYFLPSELYSIMSMVPEYLHDKRFKIVYDRVKDGASRKLRAVATAVGCNYINFELPDINGKKTLFSNIVDNNRYTVLDFWASWCSPCRQEMPVIRKIAKDYASKGVAVVSLSLDSNDREWKDGVSSLQMTWTQLCEPKGGSAEVASAYGVETIPQLLLIDSKGEIIMRGEPAYRVAEKLKELLK